MDIKQKQLKLLKETVEFYSTDTSRRAENKGGCFYLTDDGRRCAIGRLCSLELARTLKDKFGSNTVGTSLVFKRLPEEIQELGQEFLNQLQAFHDENTYWDEKGLTTSGKERLIQIKEDIEEGNINF